MDGEAKGKRKVKVSELTIFGAEATKGQLLAALEAAEEVEVDLSQVAEMDSAGLQLMLSARRKYKSRQRSH